MLGEASQVLVTQLYATVKDGIGDGELKLGIFINKFKNEKNWQIVTRLGSLKARVAIETHESRLL